jgi:hypothetical protein
LTQSQDMINKPVHPPETASSEIPFSLIGDSIPTATSTLSVAEMPKTTGGNSGNVRSGSLTHSSSYTVTFLAVTTVYFFYFI